MHLTSEQTLSPDKRLLSVGLAEMFTHLCVINKPRQSDRLQFWVVINSTGKGGCNNPTAQ